MFGLTDIENRFVVAKGRDGGEGGLADANYYL